MQNAHFTSSTSFSPTSNNSSRRRKKSVPHGSAAPGLLSNDEKWMENLRSPAYLLECGVVREKKVLCHGPSGIRGKDAFPVSLQLVRGSLSRA